MAAKLSFFVACPYALFPLDDYKKVFASIARAYAVEFRFADEQITNKHVLEKVTDYIRTSDISLFDITGWNPNVALEFGIAVGLNRRYYILLNTKIDPNKDAPSDIKGLDRVQYASNSELEAKMIILIKQIIPTEVKSENAFDALRARIEEALLREPGQRAVDLVRELGEEANLLRSVLQSMTWSGQLTTTGATKGTRYSLVEPAEPIGFAECATPVNDGS